MSARLFTLVAVVAVALVAVTAAAGTAAAASIGNPPAKPVRRFTIVVRGMGSKPAMLLSPSRRRTRGAFRLKATGHARQGVTRLRVVLPRRVAPGAYFVIACAPTPHGRCVASQRALVVAAAHGTRPLNATVALAPTRAVSQMVGTAGGTITTADSRGDRFVLHINANSVADGTQITMTPIAGLGGAGRLGRFVAGVQFAPEGLALYHGATLTITPSRRLPVSHQVAFGYTSSGDALHAVPVAPTRKTIELTLAHFSGAGVTDDPAVANLPAGEGGSQGDSAFYEALLASLVSRLRESGHSVHDGSEASDDFTDAAGSVFDEWSADIMSNEYPPGLNADDAARVAIKDLLTWAHDKQALGFSVDERELFAKLVRLQEGIYTRAQKRCATTHDLTVINDQIIPAAGALQKMGQPEIPFSELLQCARFRVDIDSTVTLSYSDYGGSSGEYDYHYTTAIPIQYDAAQGEPIVIRSLQAAPGTYQVASGSVTTTTFCPDETHTESVVQTLTNGNANTNDVLDFTLPLGSAVTDKTIKLTVDSGASETYHLVPDNGCGGSAAPSDITQQNWWDSFVTDRLMAGDGTPSPSNDNAMVLTLDPGSGDVIAQKTYTTQSDTTVESTTIKVIHTPPSA